jgi:dihydroneopterin aldolase
MQFDGNRVVVVDIIYLHGIKVECVIGVWAWERQIKQLISIDLDMATDIRRAAASDDLADTLNYKAIAKRVQSYVGNSRFQLVETLAEKTADLLMTEFGIPWCRVRVNKGGAVRGARDVGVVIERGEGRVA